MHDGADAGREDADEVAGDAAAGDVGDAFAVGQQRLEQGGVGAMDVEKHVAERFVEFGRGGFQGGAGGVRGGVSDAEGVPGEGVAVGVEAVAREGDEDVVGGDGLRRRSGRLFR